MTHSGDLDSPAPQVSVICVFLDAERWLCEAIDSVLAQYGVDFEVLLVDDGSSDQGTEIAKEYARRFPTQIRYLEHPGHANRGISASRNLGMQAAHGTFVTFIDADDRWRAGKLADQLAIFASHPGLAMVSGAVNYWRSWDGGMDETVLTGHVQDMPIAPPEAVLALYPLGAAQAPSVDAMIRRDVALELGGCEDKFPGLYEDQVLFAKIMLEHAVWFSSSVWFDYRQHPDSCSELALDSGKYRQLRRKYLDWLRNYLRFRPGVGYGKIYAAIARESCKLGLIARIARRLRRTAKISS